MQATVAPLRFHAVPKLLLNLIQLDVLPPLALYIHLPWCMKKCPYCDFNSHKAAEIIPEDAYVRTLLTDLEQALPQIWGRSISSIFIGGGTPSLFSESAIDNLFSGLRARLPIKPETEITLEANPGTFEQERFRAYHEIGINRLSLGIQSFQNAFLEKLGRVHNGEEALQAAHHAREIFPRLNLDLMYGLPEQTLADLQMDLSSALQTNADHLSVYHLTLEPNTFFARYPPALPDDDLCADMQEHIEKTLAVAGFGHYEVSAYAKPGQQCLHNANYWKFGDYLGIGAGAHSKISFPDRIIRQARIKDPNRYMQLIANHASFLQENEVAISELPFEFMLNALRLIEGVDHTLFSERTGLRLSILDAKMHALIQKGLLEHSITRLKTTEKGQRFLNEVLQEFLIQK